MLVSQVNVTNLSKLVGHFRLMTTNGSVVTKVAGVTKAKNKASRHQR
jgi:hypothetical protein